MSVIYVQGAPVFGPDVAANALELSIYEEKQRSRTAFHYPTKEALSFELRFRAAIVQASLDLGDSGAVFESFEKSRCNSAYWILTDRGGFQLRPQANPSAAVRDIYRNGRLYAFECATAIIIILYKAVLEIAGEAVFDRLFDRLYLYSWHHDTDLKLVTKYRTGEAFPGDVQYFKNPDVNPYELQWQGENAVVMPGGRFFGHGVGVTSAAFIISKLNQHRLPGSMTSAYLMDEATHPDFPELAKLFASEGPIATETQGGWPPPPPMTAAGGMAGEPYPIMARIGARQFWHG